VSVPLLLVAVPAAPEPSRAAASPPLLGFEKSWSPSLILVITGVEAGDRGPSCRSAPESTCWPTVGNSCPPVVDTWTSRRPCTVTVRRPRPVPAPPPACPQSVPRSVGRATAGTGGRWGRRPAAAAKAQVSTAAPGCVHTWGTTWGRNAVPPLPGDVRSLTDHDLPRVCTSLGTTRRDVDNAESGDRRSAARRRATSRGRPAAVDVHGCGQRARCPHAGGAAGGCYWRARLLMRAVSSVTCV
jgi:hypothetical protein